jgi:hypothetical protein
LSGLFLGVAERSPYRTIPPVKVRPLFQASPDRTRWVEPDIDFPNSGMLGWWQPPAEADQFKAWTFQTEESTTFDSTKDSHDLYFVRTPASPAYELIDFPHLAEPEDIRLCLTKEGIPASRCASRSLIFRCANGTLLGPLELVLREDRLLLEPRETLAQLAEMPEKLELTTWANHVFMPPKFSLIKIGELDLSTDVLFVKRMLRESRDVSSALLDRARLTEKQISSFSSVLETLPLNTSRQQRLRRLGQVARDLKEHISLQEDGLDALLSIPDVGAAIEQEKQKTRQSVLEERNSEVEALAEKRKDLASGNEALEQEAARLHAEIRSEETRLTKIHAQFKRSIAESFQEAENSAGTFLGNVALIKAAVGVSPGANDIRSDWSERAVISKSLTSGNVLQALTDSFSRSSLDGNGSIALMSSWASGLVPILEGDLATDCLNCVFDTLTGGESLVLSIPPAMTAVSDLRDLSGRSRNGYGSLASFLERVSSDEGLAIVVLEGLNLCQIDNAVLPLLSDLSCGDPNQTSRTSSGYTHTRLGPWPKNLLIAGTFVPSALSMPKSRRMWQYCSLISPKRKSAAAQDARHFGLESISAVEWHKWVSFAVLGSDSPMRTLAKYICSKTMAGSSYERSMAAFASALDKHLDASDQEKLRMLLRSAILPALVTSQRDSRALLAGAPLELSEPDRDIVEVIEILDNSVPQNG